MRSWIAAGSIAAVIAASPLAGPASGEEPEPSGCLEETPAAISTAVPGSAPVALRVLLQTDHVPRDAVIGAVDEATRVLGTAGIDATFVVRRLDLRSDGKNVEGDRESLRVADAHEAQRRATGRSEPAGFDLVHLLTTRDLYEDELGGGPNFGVAGHAECIGGIRFDGWGYSVSEVPPRQRYLKGTSIKMQAEMRGRAMAHELGHLMGAHHHYTACGPTAVEELSESQGGVCSVMFPDTAVHGPSFDPVNAQIVRGHAEEWAGH